jgi:sec-independent protein translocase protein TatC
LEIPKPGASVLLTLAGILFLVILSQWWTLSFIIPLVLEYLASDAAAAGLDTTWRLSAFIGFIINLCFAGLVAFQTPLVTLVAIRSGAVESRVIRNHRKHVWFASIVMGALLSPPDPLSMILVAAPMLLLFEVALLIDKLFGD